MSFQSSDTESAQPSSIFDDVDIEVPAGFEPLAEHPQILEAIMVGLEKIEEELAVSLETADELAQATTRHLLDAGGKRVRPMLGILAGMLADENVATGEVDHPNADVRQIAVALELTHLATLYHDDVMDEADQRRGATAAHLQWSNSIAILAGDLIFARASREMAEQGPEAVNVHSHTFERLVMGQLWETVGPAEGEDPLDHYLKVLDGKTASLIAAVARLGAIKGGSDDKTVEMMTSYGDYVGMAFQLADDIIDVSSSSEESGKVQGTDLKERVPTLPVLLLRQAAVDGDAQAQNAVELVDGPLDTDEQLATAVEALCAHPVIDQAWALTHQWSQRAVDAIAELPESPVKQALIAFARYVVERKY